MQIARLTNIGMPIAKSRPHAVEARNQITKFLSNPIKENLPPRIKTNVLSGRRVFVCFAPNGERIFVKTNFKSEVLLSIRYEENRFFAELQAKHRGKRKIIQPETEVFLIKDDVRIYYEGQKLRKYMKPKFISNIFSSGKKQTYKHVESWLKNQAPLPEPVLRRANDKGRFPLCHFNGEPIDLPPGTLEYAGKPVLEIFKEKDGLKYVYAITEDNIWEFALRCIKSLDIKVRYRGPFKLCKVEVNKA